MKSSDMITRDPRQSCLRILECLKEAWWGRGAIMDHDAQGHSLILKNLAD
jgi:hypothetical protein